MLIIKHGTRILTNIGNIDGIITGVTIRQNYEQYEVSYFSEGTYKTCWLTPSEFSINGKYIKQRIGFLKMPFDNE
jgi:hypothetical protein